MAHIRLFKHYIRTPYVILAMVEAFAIIAVVYFAQFLAHGWGSYPAHFITPGLFLPALWGSFVLLSCNLAMSVYAAHLKDGFAGMMARSLVSFCLLGSLLLYLSNLVFPALALESGVTSLVVMLSFMLVLVIRVIFIRIVDAKVLRRRVLIIGAGAKARLIYDQMLPQSHRQPFQLVGFVPGERDEVQVDSSLVVDYQGAFSDYVLEQRIDEIVVAPDDRRLGFDGKISMRQLLDCKMNGASVIEALSFCEKELQIVELSLLHPGWLIFSDGFQFKAMRTYSKRAFDLVASGVLLALTWPLMLFTALAIALESRFRHGVLYRQVRTGQDDIPFELLKFRSMRPDAEKDGARWASQNDDRVTRVGRFIRMSRLDELPQIYNILRGEMSFIGPRPERPEFVAQLRESIPYYDERHRVKPGLMGWAQLNYPYGASVEDAEHKLRYDLYYIKNHSLLLDLMIVVQTVEVVLVGNGVR